MFMYIYAIYVNTYECVVRYVHMSKKHAQIVHFFTYVPIHVCTYVHAYVLRYPEKLTLIEGRSTKRFEQKCVQHN